MGQQALGVDRKVEGQALGVDRRVGQMKAESGGASFRSGPERRTNESGKRGASFRDEPESRGCLRSGSESMGKAVGVIQKVGRKPCTWTRKFAFV